METRASRRAYRCILIRRDQSNVGANAALIKSDAELVRRCRAGDSVAWEQVVHEYSRRVYNLAYRFTGRHESAEDLTQEVFVRVYRSLEQYDAQAGDLCPTRPRDRPVLHRHRRTVAAGTAGVNRRLRIRGWTPGPSGT